METIEDAFTQFFGYPSTLNFATFKNDFCGLLNYLDQILESEEFSKDNDESTAQPKNDLLGQFPMYIAELSTPIELAGRSIEQSIKRGIPPRGCYDSDAKSIPAFLHFHYPELNQLFFTPQQAILLFGTFAAAVHIHVEKLEEGDQKMFDAIFQRLANELSIEKEHLIKILSKCYQLVFNVKFEWNEKYIPLHSNPCNLIYTSPATGSSTLYPILSVLFHHLNIPFAYIADKSIVDSKYDTIKRASGFYYAPKQSQNLQFAGCFPTKDEYTEPGFQQFSVSGFDQSTILLMDCPDNTYIFNEWYSFSLNLFKKYCLNENSRHTLFSFGTTEDAIEIWPGVRKPSPLQSRGIFAYLYSPSMLNFKLGITQLQLFRHFQQQFKLLLPSSSSKTLSAISTTELLQQSKLNENKKHDDCDGTKNNNNPQLQQKPSLLTFEQQQALYRSYFGTNLQQLINEYQTRFEQLLSSSSNISKVSQSAHFNKLLQSELINNPQYYPLLYNIILHPMPDILSTKQSMILSRDAKEILSTIINDIKIDDNLLLSTLQNTSISEFESKSTSKSASKSRSKPTTATTETSSSTTIKSTNSSKSNKNSKTSNSNTSTTRGKLPSFYLVPKRINVIPNINIDHNQFNNTKIFEQYWKQFQSILSIDSTINHTPTATNSNTTTITTKHLSPLQQETKIQSNHQPSSLSILIHNLWFDLSIFTLHGLPTHRFLSLLSSKPRSSDGKHSQMIRNSLYQLCQISPRSSLRCHIKLNGQKHFYSTLDPAETSDLRRVKAQLHKQEYFFSDLSPHNPFLSDINPRKPTYGINWINSIVAFSERFDCYLPFDGFNTTPIRKIISYNSIYGLEQPISAMIEQCDPDISNDHFDRELLKCFYQNNDHINTTIIIPPKNYKYANFIILQTCSLLFLNHSNYQSVGSNYAFSGHSSIHYAKIDFKNFNDIPFFNSLNEAAFLSTAPNQTNPNQIPKAVLAKVKYQPLPDNLVPM